MAKVGLSSIINGSFINSFVGVASGGSSSATDLAKALNGGASKVSLSDGLRLGARAFGTAVQNLNSLVSFVNISDGVLKDLGDLTDDMIALTERATKTSVGKSERGKLVLEFEDLATRFQKIMEDAKVGERELLNVQDIEELFITLGLEPEESESVAALFEKFIIYGESDELIDPDKPNTDPFKMPASAYKGPNKTLTVGAFSQTKITNTDPDYASIIPGGSVDLKGSDLTIDNGGASILNGVSNLFNTDPASGYSVIQSSENYLGYNNDNSWQLYLVANTGVVTQQLTNHTGGIVSGPVVQAADISSDGLHVVYSVITGAGDREVVSGVMTGLGTDPATATYTTHDSDPVNSYNSVKISSDGSYIAYQEIDVATDERLVFRDTATGTRNNTLYNQVNRNESFDFIDTNKLAIARVSGSTYDLATFDSNNASSIIASNVDNISKLTTVEESLTSNGKYYIAFYDSENERVDLYKKGDGLSARHSTTGSTINQLSLAATVSGAESVKLGITGIISGDADNELYSFSSDSTQDLVIPTRLATISQDIGNILDSANKLMRKPEAIRLLHDLKGLREQIDENIGALESARQLVLDNIELVRNAGLTFLDLSDQLQNEEEADVVARIVRNEIRKAPGRALAQAENLQALAVAALTADPDESGLDS